MERERITGNKAERGLPDEQKLTVEFLITQIAWIAPVSRREA